MTILRALSTAAAAATIAVVTSAASPTPYPPTPSPPPPPAVECGSHLTQDTTLTRDLVCRDGNGLTMDDGVVLDLGGHRLVGPGRGTGAAVTGVYSPTVRNGTIARWRFGVTATEPDSGGTVQDVTIRETEYGIIGSLGAVVTAASSTFVDNGTGVGASLGAFAVVTDSTFVRNGIGVRPSADYSGARIDRSAFRDNDIGVDCEGGGTSISGSVFRSNGTAIVVHGYDCGLTLVGSTLASNGTGVRQTSNWMDNGYGTVMRDNVLRDNDVAVTTQSSVLLEHNTFRGNATAVTATWTPDEIGLSTPLLQLLSNDLRSNGDAILSEMPSRVGSNVVVRNSGVGIRVADAVDLGGNVAYGNGVEPQCVGVVCAGRPGRP